MQFTARCLVVSLCLAGLVRPAVAELPAAEVPAGGPSAWDRIAPFFSPPPELVDDYGDYRSPLRFDDGRPVENADDWAKRRQEILRTWHAIMGPWPPVIEEPDVEYLERQPREGFVQHTVRFEIAPGHSTRGYLLVPDRTGDQDAAASRSPAVLVVYYEPETAVGLEGENRDFALKLARRGFVTLSIGLGNSLYYPSQEAAQIQPLSALAWAAANAWHVLAGRDDVDPERIGITGHSYGGKWAMFASCLNERFACAAWSDGGIVFDETRGNVNYWEPWYLGYDGPDFRPRGIPNETRPRTGAYKRLMEEGRDLHELHALMAPRPFLVSGGSEDPPERWQALNHTVAVNRLLGFENRVAMTNRPTHGPTPESNEQMYAFFEHFLKDAPDEPGAQRAPNAAPASSAAAGDVPPERRLLYVAVPGIRNYLEYGGHGLLVFDIEDGHRFVRRIPTAGLDEEGRPLNVKGICASAETGRLYISTLRTLICLDLATDEVLWERAYEGGCDRMAVSPDGRTIYLPSLEQDHWHVVEALSGDVIETIVPRSGAHNTIYGPDGREAYLAGLKSPLLTVAETRTHTAARTVGPFSAGIRPFTINHRQTLCFVNVNDLLGFEVGDLKSGERLHRVEVQGFEKGPVKRHGCPSHGIGLTPDETELWVTDAANSRMHVFDATVFPPRQLESIELRDQPGWITFSLDGRYAYPSTGDVIETATRRIVARLTDETGAAVQSEKMLEVVVRGEKAVRVGDQFGIGRAMEMEP